MNSTPLSFYAMSNLDLYAPGTVSTMLIHSGVSMVIGLCLFIFFRQSILYGTGILLLVREKKELAKKQSLMHELILMKDVQTELDKEIEEATLRATFQS